jgi:hypothetical protein
MLTLEFDALSKPSDTISLPANVSVPSAVERLSPSKEFILESGEAGHKYEWIGLEKQAKFAQEYRDYDLYLSRQDLHCSGHRARPSGLPGPRASPAWYQALPEQAQRLACWEHCVSDLSGRNTAYLRPCDLPSPVPPSRRLPQLLRPSVPVPPTRRPPAEGFWMDCNQPFIVLQKLCTQ